MTFKKRELDECKNCHNNHLAHLIDYERRLEFQICDNFEQITFLEGYEEIAEKLREIADAVGKTEENKVYLTFTFSRNDIRAKLLVLVEELEALKK